MVTPILRPRYQSGPHHADDSAWKYLDLYSTVRGLLFPEKHIASARGPDFAAVNDDNGNGKLEFGEIPDTWAERPDVNDSTKDVTYSGTALRAAFASIDRNSRVRSRATNGARKRHDWQKIWIWPALMAGVTSLLFWLGFHDRVSTADE